jgi:radical SAM methylthiotransferase, MiaB/RimO family
MKKTNSFYIRTFGCKVNQYETQLISDKYNKEKFTCVAKPEDAGVIIFNSCTVTAEADKECEYLIRKSLKLPDHPKIIVTGCFAKNRTDYLKNKYPEAHILTDKAELFCEPEKQTIKNFEKRSRAFVKIQDGCNSFCSYCIIPYIRNVLWSKPCQTVLEEIETLVKNGYSEIVLTGIHVGKYEGGISPLLQKIIQIPLDFRVRISSIELNEIDDKLISLMAENPDKICRHLHIPLQSGSDEVLKAMNRKYGTKDYESKVSEITRLMPDIALTSDIITGFPSETEKNHAETCLFLRKNPFARFHIFRYSDREGTKASKSISKVPQTEIKKRSKELFEIDIIKRTEFLNRHKKTIRKAVSSGKNKALTDNYITVNECRLKEGIFDTEINENCEI